MKLTGLLILLTTIVVTCTRERPLQPQPAVEPLVHEPWEDREAEEFALSMSGRFSASPYLYDSIRVDLARIRATWGDTFPFVRVDEFIMSARPGRALLVPDLETLFDMRAGRYPAWDSLNEQLWMTVSDLTYQLPRLSSRARINGWRLVELYEQLPGIRAVEPSGISFQGGNIPPLCGLENAAGRHYIFGKWSSCSDWCPPSEFFYFLSNADGVRYVGGRNIKDPDPTWWPIAEKAIQISQSGDDQYRYRDRVPPGCVTDLEVVGNQIGDSVDVAFTNPGDNSGEREPSGFAIMHSIHPITEENWPPDRYPAIHVWAGRVGERAHKRVKGLDLNALNYIAVRMSDASGNWSPISNVVSCQNPD